MDFLNAVFLIFEEQSNSCINILLYVYIYNYTKNKNSIMMFSLYQLLFPLFLRNKILKNLMYKWVVGIGIFLYLYIMMFLQICPFCDLSQDRNKVLCTKHTVGDIFQIAVTRKFWLQVYIQQVFTL